MVSDDEGPAPGPFNTMSTDDWEEKQHASLGMCTVNLKRMFLGPDHDALGCIEAKDMKKETPTKRNVKRLKRTTRARVPNL